jgi:hypothetical protein
MEEPRPATDFTHAPFGTWGNVELPACFPTPPEETQIAMSLSLWKDLESVAAFTYHGAHGEALTKRREWFEKYKLPIYVAWWVPADHQIDLEGRQRQTGASPPQRADSRWLRFCPAFRFRRERKHA